MNNLLLPHYNLHTTLLGGQAFNFDFDEGRYYGFTQDKVITLQKENDVLYWQTYPTRDDLDFVKNYLRLDINYPKIIKQIQKDKYIKAAIKKNPNIRLLKQDFEQALFSFLISANNNIKSIRQIVRAMNKRFGKTINVSGEKIHLFPRTEILAKARLEDLLSCKLGFRAKFIKSAANHLLETNLHKTIHSLKEEEARTKLLEIKGIGNKIADCILVFSLGFDNVTPLDVWGKRVLTDFYGLDKKMNYEKMRTWISDYFQGHTSWAGQFLFEYIRKNGK